MQQLLPGEENTPNNFSLRFLLKMEVDDAQAWQILYDDEAHFYLNGINTDKHEI